MKAPTGPEAGHDLFTIDGDGCPIVRKKEPQTSNALWAVILGVYITCFTTIAAGAFIGRDILLHHWSLFLQKILS